jgi:hypothetical protein
VRGGDRLAIRLDVLAAAPSGTRPGFGTLTLAGTMTRLASAGLPAGATTRLASAGLPASATTRLAGGGQPEVDVLRTRFRGWFARRPGQ